MGGDRGGRQTTCGWRLILKGSAENDGITKLYCKSLHQIHHPVTGQPHLQTFEDCPTQRKMRHGRSFRTLYRLFSISPYRKADPWPLPHTKQHMEATAIPPNIPKPIPVPRHNESLETLRARLTYQTRKRGTLESDLIMSTFAKEHLHSLTREELVELDQVTHLEKAPSRFSRFCES